MRSMVRRRATLEIQRNEKFNRNFNKAAEGEWEEVRLRKNRGVGCESAMNIEYQKMILENLKRETIQMS